MVQMANPGNLRPESAFPGKVAPAPALKLEAEDPLDDEHGPFNKRSKLAAPSQQFGTGSSLEPSQASRHDLFHEPSPLGLRLKKTPSFMDLIDTRLSQMKGTTLSCDASSENFGSGKMKDHSSVGASFSTEKIKASNFPATLLTIGTWQYVSRYEGDLVAKCYYAKHKLVWEVLEGGLKSKIEIQWSDISAIKATCPENEPEALEIVLSRQPIFFRETNPQPRKHTLWQATSDFTGGQASIHRRHFLQCSHGLLNRHFEKLIQCDPRLYTLSRQPDIILESPYFKPHCAVVESQDGNECHGFDKLKDLYGSPIQGFPDAGSPDAVSTISTGSDVRDSIGRPPDHGAQETSSHCSVMDARIVEEHATARTEKLRNAGCWDQFKVPGLRSSMSMTDLMSHIENCYSEQMTSGNPLISGHGLQNKYILEELAQHLFNDSQISAADEQTLMSRVNSFCNLLQKDAGISQSLQKNSNGKAAGDEGMDNYPKLDCGFPAAEGESNDACVGKRQASISRKDSFGELLMHLPRIASLPKFLFNIAEDAENQPT